MRSVVHESHWLAVETVAQADGSRVWCSDPVSPGFDLADVIPSWSARTPGRSWISVSVSLRCDDGWSPWVDVARWCERDPGLGGAFERTSVPGQTGPCARADVDRVIPVEGHIATAYRVQVRLVPDGHTWPHLHAVHAVASCPGAPTTALTVSEASEPLRPVLVADLPALSQQVHRGHYPQWDGGGASWCSPTSTSMVLGRWGLWPTPEDLAWVDPPTDAVVDHAARATYDAAYGGAGNWAFNTAYASTFGVTAYVTRLTGLAEASRYLTTGIPLVASVRHGEGELTGAGYTTAGHLLVIAGITADARVWCHDPASRGVPDNAAVPIAYDRSEFERAWLRDGSGVVYVIAPAEVLARVQR